MNVKIRLEAHRIQDLDEHEAALRAVLTIPGVASRDYPNRSHGKAGSAGCRRYLESAGINTRPVALAPRVAAEEAKRRRDLAGELGALMAADAELTSRPWYPLVPGDVVLTYLSVGDGAPAMGETYLADGEDTDIVDNTMLRMVSNNYGDQSTDEFSFYELWFEAGSDSLVIIRAGAVVHGCPTYSK